MTSLALSIKSSISLSDSPLSLRTISKTSPFESTIIFDSSFSKSIAPLFSRLVRIFFDNSSAVFNIDKYGLYSSTVSATFS